MFNAGIVILMGHWRSDEGSASHPRAQRLAFAQGSLLDPEIKDIEPRPQKPLKIGGCVRKRSDDMMGYYQEYVGHSSAPGVGCNVRERNTSQA